MQEVQLFISGEKVDLFGDETISLTQTIQNVKDIKDVFTNVTKQFNLPATKTNNQIFKHYYNWEIIGGFDARFKVDSLIKLSGSDFEKGKLRLNKVELKDSVAYSYNVVFFGETVALEDTLGSDELSTLNLSAYDHTYSSAVAKAGMKIGLTTGGTTSVLRDVIYPFITHTKQFEVDNSPVDDSFHVEGGTDGIAYLDLKPAIKLKHIITAIAAKYTGISFSNDYFASNVFNEMYLWLHREKGLITSGGTNQVFVMYDYDWVFDTGTDLFPVHGLFVYNFSWTVTPVIGTGSYDILVTDTNSSKGVQFSENNVTGNRTFNFSIDNVIEYNIWDFVWQITTAGGITTFHTALSIEEVGGDTGTYLDPNGGTPESMTSNIIISEQMPKMKIIDFLTSLFKLSNLTGYVVDDVIQVKTLDDYYATGTVRDISKYVDVTDNGVSRALPYRKIEFKYPKPKTYLTIKGNEISSFEFGNLDYEGGDVFDGGNYEIGVGFEHMQFERMSNQDTSVLTDLQWGWFVDSKREATIGNPLIFYNINRNAVTTPIKWSDDTSVTTYNSPSNSTQDAGQTLNFGAEVDEFTGLLNEESLFSNYYTTYIESLFLKGARVFNFTAFLPLSILLNYSLNDILVIKGKQFTINSINTNLQTGKSNLELINKDAAYVAPDTPVGVYIAQMTSTTNLTAILTSIVQVGMSAGMTSTSTLTAILSLNRATPTLQQVTDVGSVSTNGITVDSILLSTELNLQAKSIGGTVQTATGDGTTTIDWKNGNMFNFQFGAFNEVFTFIAPTNPGCFILKLVQDSVGSRTVTWPATVKWTGSAAPTLTTTSTTGYGPELIVNGDFATDTDWVKGTGWTIGGGVATKVASAKNEIVSSVSAGILQNTLYEVTFTLSNRTGGAFLVILGGANTGTSRSSNGTYTESIYTSLSSDGKMYIQGTSGSSAGDIDNVSVKAAPTTGKDMIAFAWDGTEYGAVESLNLG